jgi:hypothetical protein
LQNTEREKSSFSFRYLAAESFLRNEIGFAPRLSLTRTSCKIKQSIWLRNETQQVSVRFEKIAHLNFSFFFAFIFSQNATNLERFQLSISKREMYPVQDRVVDNLVQDLTELPILHVGEFCELCDGEKLCCNF